MGTIVYTAYYEWKQMMRMRSVPILMIGLPLLLIVLLGYGLDTSPKPVKTAVWTDGGEAAQALENELANDAVKRYVTVIEAESELDAAAAVKNGAADYGFAVLEQPAAVGLKVVVYPGQFAERNLTVEAALDRILAEAELRALPAAAFGPDFVPAQPAAGEAVRVGTLLAGNVAYGSVSAIQYYAASNLVMFLLFSGSSAAMSLLHARERGTLHRVNAIPIRLPAYLAGKFVSFTAFGIVQSAVIVFFTKAAYGVDWGGRYGLILLVCVLTSIFGMSLAVVLASFIRTSRGTETTFSMIVTVMTFVSGGMIPTLAPAIREAGKLTVNHWANEAIKGLMSGGGWSDVAGDMMWLAALAAAAAAGLLVRMRKAVALS